MEVVVSHASRGRLLCLGYFAVNLAKNGGIRKTFIKFVQKSIVMQDYEVPAEVAGWMNMIGCAVTICDCNGVILYMNDLSRKTFARHGDMIGKNLFSCHSERSQQMIRHMLATGDTNAYTIEKGGIRKLIYQTPWRDSTGWIAGMAEISIPLPGRHASL